MFFKKNTNNSTGITVAVAGYREFTDTSVFEEQLDKILSKYKVTKIHTGDCRGTDTMAVTYAIKKGIPYTVFTANWNKYGRSAGPIRNQEMIKGTKLLVAFAHRNSKGTFNTIKLARKNRIKTIIFKDLIFKKKRK